MGTEENKTENELPEEDARDDADDAEETEDEGSDDETEDAEASDESEAGEDAEADEELSAWQEKARLARELWDVGNNADLKKVLDELEQAPSDETEALEVVREMRRRLKPDPVAIGLWLLTLGVFCLLTYLFVLK